MMNKRTACNCMADTVHSPLRFEWATGAGHTHGGAWDGESVSLITFTLRGPHAIPCSSGQVNSPACGLQ